MKLFRLDALGKVASCFAPPLVLTGLGAAGWLGHAYHWNFAHAVEAVHQPALSAESLEKPAHAAGSGKCVGADCPRPASSNLPDIQFTSAEGAKSCGTATAVVSAAPMDDYVTANAVVGYDQTRLAQLALRVPGIVSHVERRLGDHVKTGDPLVIIDSADVGEAKTQLLEACLVYKLKSQHLQRLSEVRHAIPQREYAEACAACELARAQRFNALQKLINLGFSLGLDQLESSSADDLAGRLHLLGLPASYEPTTASYNLIPLVAPFAGVVTTCEVVRGESVEPLKPLYAVADTSRMWIHLNVRQDDAARLKIGAPVIFESDLISRPVQGTLTWIGTEIDQRTRTIQARAEADNPLLDDSPQSADTRRLLQAGAFGSAKILIERHPATAVVPNDAVHWQWEIGRDIVFVCMDDGCTFAPRVVHKGLVHDGYVQILSGLEPGDRIVTAGSRVLSTELSEHLQKQIGDNAMAVRNFRHSQELAQDSPSNPLQDESSKCSLTSFPGP